MSIILKFRARNRVVRHDPPQRRCPIPNPRSRQREPKQDRKPHLLSVLMISLVATGLGVLELEDNYHRSGANTGTARYHAPMPRSLNGGNAWNRIGGGFAGVASQTITGQVTHVRDGDTFVIGSTPIRIANLNCAESGTLAGDQATQRARLVVAGQIVTCRLNTQKSYDRLIGKCSLVGGRDFGQIMIAESSCRPN
ncbi:thermonuclease family protein [Roseovarius arcticus]|uniref:thermonuclease family protein n=1 Tax=Roseovarius arcticus TaxID=2547404 RepID=UPI0011100626|nr:hypothetical protein [Roseovarius arcticus]